jgi:hypothetical protein
MISSSTIEYPKSSCNCYDCEYNDYKFPDSGYPTNMSVRNCNFSPYYNCYNKKPFKVQNEPDNLKGFTYFNPDTLTYDNTFEQVECPYDKNKIVYASTDPRLVGVPQGGQVQTLDRPPVNSAIKLADIYNENLRNYGKNYRTYTDIKSGQIVYYVDKEIQDAFFNPLFENNSTSVGTIYVDPMGSIKPQYDRIPIYNNNLLDTDNNTHYKGGLSWIQDSCESREDLIALQMRKHNQSRYEPRWTGNVN